MTMKNSVLIVFALTACQGDGDLPAYYDGGPAPTPSAISQYTEAGNVGGDVVTISGSNFGGDHDSITVVFGSQKLVFGAQSLWSHTPGFLVLKNWFPE